jgi:hypothetical protein
MFTIFDVVCLQRAEYSYAADLVFLKGQCHEMDLFFQGLNILISTFCVCADGF